MSLRIQVYGTPAPQGSKRHVGRGIMVESSAKVKPWREAVKHAALTELALGPETAQEPASNLCRNGHHGGCDGQYDTATAQPCCCTCHPFPLGVPLTGPVEVRVTFHLARPKGHYGSGRNADVVRPSAPAHPAGKPDIDKLLRSTLDALGDAGVWRDDSQVVSVEARKVWTTTGAGASIAVAPALDHVRTVLGRTA